MDNETIIIIAILIVPAEINPVKMPGHNGVISTISLNELSGELGRSVSGFKLPSSNDADNVDTVILERPAYVKLA